ncbi:MAG: class I SAM-dependent methyltransferase, partial [Anaerolineales bacterium]
VIQRELDWHNQESYKRTSLNDVLYKPPAFDAVTQSGYDFLQPHAGEWILDFGGGEGKESLDLAKRGLVVVNADLSTTQLKRARDLVQSGAPDARIYYIQADAENLPFADRAFRILYGKAILHHLDIKRAAQEIKRILWNEGKATFAEPMAHHPLFKLARTLTPSLRTVDEHPLTENATRSFVGHFAEDHTTSHFLTAPGAYVLRVLPGGEKLFRWTHRLLQKLDDVLFSRFPKIQKWAWYRVVNVIKSQAGSNPDNSTAA